VCRCSSVLDGRRLDTCGTFLLASFIVISATVRMLHIRCAAPARRDQLGCEKGQRTMKDRGRWGSDVAFVYARSLLRDQLDASAAVADADAQELEAVVSGWVQPSTFR
jgi:hypothetical protein